MKKLDVEAVPGDAMKQYRLTWQEAEALCVRDEVDEALREFVHDSTGDNAIGLARCIVETWLRHAPPQAPAVPAGPSDALRMALAYVRWQAFGECRSVQWDGPPPEPAAVDEALVAALAASSAPK